MTRYFFHTEDGQARLDAEGMEFRDPTVARVEAVRLMGELLRDAPLDFWTARALKLIVTDGGGQILFILDLRATEAPVLPDPEGRR